MRNSGQNDLKWQNHAGQNDLLTARSRSPRHPATAVSACRYSEIDAITPGATRQRGAPRGPLLTHAGLNQQAGLATAATQSSSALC